CHTQQSGFSDPNVFSEGFEGNLTGRNSMGLSNARYYQSGHFFWDERAETLEEQVLMPIQDPVEMGMDLDSLERKLSTTYYYPILFSEAFGDSTITAERISLALAQFVRSMVSYESLYDQAIEANGGSDDGNLPLLSSTENLGKSLFFGRGGCNNCHSTNVFIADQAFNNGLDAGENEDNGVGGVTGRNNDLGLFKVPSLRNIGLGTPFMHDGRFSTLREVVTFYNDGVQDHPNISREMLGRNGEIRRLNLSEDEIDAIVAFMETLTDENFIQDEKFSDPFIAP
ncbi:MAG: cytochrome c peroxidase, partial [Bacteroidota bacterium]